MRSLGYFGLGLVIFCAFGFYVWMIIDGWIMGFPKIPLILVGIIIFGLFLGMITGCLSEEE